jgi:hypothetical protein
MSETNHAEENAKGWLSSILEMVDNLEAGRALEEQGEENSLENTDTAIHDAPLSVMVRDGWRLVGVKSDGPVEYEILLTTGGPALRIIGTLGPHDEPDDWPRLEYQDWGTPWTEYLPAREHREALQKFASCFWYGDN